MSSITAIAKIVKVNGAELFSAKDCRHIQDLMLQISNVGLQLLCRSADGFYEAYEMPDTSSIESTIFYLDQAGGVIHCHPNNPQPPKPGTAYENSLFSTKKEEA